jgi:CheY-like chemotaxis protein
MTEVKRTVLAAVEDMFFLAKIEAAAKVVGVDLVEARSVEKLNEHLDVLNPDLIILDLNSKAWDPLEVIRRIRREPKFKSTPVVAFLSHVQVELERAARAAGCENVIPRSAFSRDLPQILQTIKRAGSPDLS